MLHWRHSLTFQNLDGAVKRCRYSASIWEKTLVKFWFKNCPHCVSFMTTKFQGRRVWGGGNRPTSFRQCLPLSGQTAVWFPVSELWHDNCLRWEAGSGPKKGTDQAWKWQHHNPLPTHFKKASLLEYCLVVDKYQLFKTSGIPLPPKKNKKQWKQGTSEWSPNSRQCNS